MATASLLAWLVILAWITFDNARLDEGHVFEAEGTIRPPDAFTPQWWADAASAYPGIALVTLGYALPLMAVFVFHELSRPRASGAAAGAVAVAPLAIVWIVLAAVVPQTVSWAEVLVPVLVLVAIGALGGLAAAAARYRRVE